MTRMIEMVGWEWWTGLVRYSRVPLVKFAAWKWIFILEIKKYDILLFYIFTKLASIKYLRPSKRILVQQSFTPRHLHYQSSLMLSAFGTCPKVGYIKGSCFAFLNQKLAISLQCRFAPDLHSFAHCQELQILWTQCHKENKKFWTSICGFSALAVFQYVDLHLDPKPKLTWSTSLKWTQ